MKREFFKNWKSKEMSKRLLIILVGLVIILLPISFIATLIIGSGEILSQYVIGAFSLASVAVGFYFWKAKNENLHKYATKYSDCESNYIEKLRDTIKESYNE